MKAIIIDDENRIVDTIIKLVEANFEDVEIAGFANNITAGYDLVLEKDPDILFLDIHLPDGSGFDLLRKFSSPRFKLIFVTGHEEYAVQAFKYSAIDYILKPIDEPELLDAVNRARDIRIREEQQLKVKALLDNYNEENILKKIILRTAECLHLVNVEDIIRCEADSNYTYFFLRERKKILVSRTIKEFDSLLKPAGFLRVHQSHLINSNYIDRYVKTDGGTMILKDNSSVPISGDRRAYILKQLESLH